jgi:hypothetical protein
MSSFFKESSMNQSLVRAGLNSPLSPVKEKPQMRVATASPVLRATVSAVVLFAFVNLASAATLFTEDFSDNSPNPNMALGTGSGSPTTDFTGDFTITSGEGSRIYLGTTDTDYLGIDFVFEATVTMAADTSPWGYAFFGMGNRDATGGFGEPGNQNLLGALDPSGNLRSRDNGADGGTAAIAEALTSGTHRLRMTWDSTTQQGLFQVDVNFTGTFTSDYSVSVNGSDNGFTSLNSRLLLGGGNGISFDDISVAAVIVPEPASGLLGIVGAALSYGMLRRWRRK